MRQHKLPHRERYARYFLALVEDNAENSATINQCLPLIRRAWDVIRTRPEDSIRYVLALRFINMRQGLGPEYLRWSERALKSAREIRDETSIVKLLLIIGLIHEEHGALRKALSFYEEALPLLRDDLLGVSALNNIGMALSRLGDRRGSLKRLEEAFRRAHNIADSYGQALTLHNIASWHERYSQDNHTVVIWLEKALKLWKTAEDRWGMANTLGKAAAVYMDLGETSKALNFYKRALTLRRDIGDKPGQWRTLNGMGLLFDHKGERERALECFAEAYELAVEIKDIKAQATIRSNLGVSFAKWGEHREALRYHKRALSIARRRGNQHGEATSLNNIGLTYYNLGKLKKARDAFEEALPLWNKAGSKKGKSSTFSNLGLVFLTLGEFERAMACFRRSLAAAKAIGDLDQQGIALNNIGLAHASSGKYGIARRLFEQALSIHKKTGNKAEESTAFSNLRIYSQ